VFVDIMIFSSFSPCRLLYLHLVANKRYMFTACHASALFSVCVL